MEKPIHIVTKKIQADKPIMEEIHERIFEHRRAYYDKPEGILIGPNEYARLMAEASKSPYHGYLLDGVDSFEGIPIRVKMTRGIDIEIKKEHFLRFATDPSFFDRLDLF